MKAKRLSIISLILGSISIVISYSKGPIMLLEAMNFFQHNLHPRELIPFLIVGIACGAISIIIGIHSIVLNVIRKRVARPCGLGLGIAGLVLGLGGMLFGMIAIHCFASM